MQKSSEEIRKNVYLTNVYYTKLQNKTKELYFSYLDKNKSYDDFEKELSKIWDNIDHGFMDKQIDKLEKMVNSNNVEEAINLGRLDDTYKNTEYWVIDEEYFKLTPESQFKKLEQRFKRNVLNQYKLSQKIIKNGDKETYLKGRIDTYNKGVNNVITYFQETTETKNGRRFIKHEPFRQVQMSTYLAMLHNVDLTRAGWNQTMSDSHKLEHDLFIIPYHPFSCLYCAEQQNQILTREQVEDIIGGEAREQVGDILHPNCKCTLSLFWDSTQISQEIKSSSEIENEYAIRQKVNGLTLERSNLRTDMKIANSLGNQEKVDQIKARISVINRNIRELRNQLPTEDLRKQVVAINR